MSQYDAHLIYSYFPTLDSELDVSEPNSLTSQTQERRLDDIMTRYHPRSGKRGVIDRFEEYSVKNPWKPQGMADEPWKPFFKSLEDFQFAEVILEAGLQEKQCETLIKIFKTCLRGDGSFNISNFADLQSSWVHASKCLTSVRCESLTSQQQFLIM